MNRGEIADQLFTIFRNNGVGTDHLTDSIEFGSPELDIDSVLFLKLFVNVENHFEIEVNYMQAMEEGVLTIGSFITYIETAIQKNAGPIYD